MPSTALARRPRAREEFAGQAQQPLYADSFDRADSAVSLGSTDGGRLPGQAWTALVGTWGISGNQAYCPSDADASAVVLDAGLADYVVQYTRTGTWTDGTNLRKLDCILRCLDANTLLFLDVAGGNIRLFKRDAGVQTQVGSSVAITGLVNGTSHVLKAVCQGLSIHVFVDGTLRTTFVLSAATESKYLTYPRVGLRLGKGGTPVEAVGADTFSVRAITDSLVFDRFARADSAAALGKAEIGAPWTAVRGTWGIASGKAYCASDADGDLALLTVGRADYVFDALANGDVTSTSVRRWPALVLRYLDPSTFLSVTFPGDGTVALAKVDGGVSSILLAAALSPAYTGGTDVRITALVQGASIRVYVNGTQHLAVTLAGADLKYRGATKCGLLLIKAGAPILPARWDTVSVRALPRYLAVWQTTDTERKLVEHGDGIVFGPKATVAWDDPRLTRQGPFRPQAGLCGEFAVTFTGLGTPFNVCSFGFDDSNPATYPAQPGFVVSSTATLLAIPPVGGGATTVPIPIALNTEYRFRVLYLAAAVAYLVSLDKGRTWTVVWIDAIPDPRVPVYASFTIRGASGILWSAKVFETEPLVPALADTFTRTALGRADTGQPWLLRTGGVAPAMNGSDIRVPAGQNTVGFVTATGMADGIIDCTANFGANLGSTKQVVIYPRYLFLTNTQYVRVAFNRVAQTIVIDHVLSNTPTTLATLSAAGFADNTSYAFRVVCVGPAVKVYQDGLEKLSVSVAPLQYVACAGVAILDNHATPDVILDTVTMWGFPAPALLVDTFDRPDSATQLGRADSGQAYAAVTNITGTVTWGIDTGRSVLATPPPGGDYLAATPLGRLGLLASVLVRSLPGNQGVAGPVFRFLDGQNYVYARLLFTTNQLGMMRNLAGVRTSVTSATVPALNPNQDYRVDVQMTGNTIEVYLDGTRYISVSVAENASAPGGGIYAISNQSRQDDLRYLPLGTALAHDTFTRADSATSMGTTEFPGTAWQTLVSGTGTTSTWGITAGKAYQVGNTGSPTFALSVVPTASPDVDISAKLAIGPGGGSILGLVVRAIDKDNFISVRLDETGDQVLLRKVVGGVGTTTLAIPTPIAVSTTYTLRVVARGIFIQAYLNGVPVINTAEGDLLTAKLHGLFAAGGVVGTTFTWDDVLIVEAAAAPVPLLASDTFTRPDTASSLGNSEVPGTAWGGVGTWGVSAGQAYSLDTTTATRLAIIPILSQYARVEADVTFQVSTPGVVLRATATGTDYLRAQLSGGFLNLFERVAGVTAALAVIPPPGGWVAGQARRLGLEATPAGLLRLFLDGGLIAAVPFTGHAGATENGAGLLTAQSATTNRWDNVLASVVPLPGACPGIVDDFARPDSIVSMGNTPAPWVAAWMQVFGGANWGISNGQAYCLDTSNGTRGAFVWHGLADFTVQADITRAPSGASDVVGFWLRCSATGGDYVHVRDGGTNLVVTERVASGTIVALASVPCVWNLGQARRLRCVLKAGVVQVYVDDVLLITQAIAGHPVVTEPYAGLYHASDTAGARYDAFSLLPLGGQPLVTDTFTRADSATALGTTELPATPQAWAAVTGTWGIASTQAYSASDGSVDVVLIQVPAGGEYAVQAVVSGPVRDTANCRLPTLALWYLDSNNVAFVDQFGGDLRLVSTVGGVAQAGGLFAANLQDGVAYILRAEVRAGSAAVYVDDVLRITVPLSAGEVALRATTNRAGLRLRKIGSPALPARWDTFSIARLT